MRLGATLTSCSALLAIAFMLAGCEAGNRANPGNDNRWPGPELTIVQPGPGQIITLREVIPHPDGGTMEDGAAKGVVRYQLPRALFDLRNTSPSSFQDGDEIWYSLDGGPFQRHTKLNEGVVLGSQAMTAGSHVLRACVYNAKRSELYGNPEATATRLFHLGSEGGEYDQKAPGTDFPRSAFTERSPSIFLVGPKGNVKRDAQGEITLQAAVSGLEWGTKHRVAYKIGDKTEYVTSPGPIKVKDLKPGSHNVDVWIEQRSDKGEWSDIPGPYLESAANFTRGTVTLNVVG